MNLYVVNIKYEFDEGFEWNEAQITVVAKSDSEALDAAKVACTQKNSHLPDYNISSTNIISVMNLDEIYSSNKIVSYK